MNLPAPQWNEADPAGSFKNIATWFCENARETFLADKTHGEMFFMFNAQGEMGAAEAPPGIERDELVAMVRGEMARLSIYGVIHISEAWTYLPKQKNDHTFKQVAQGEMRIVDLKPEDKTEALMVRIATRDGLSNIMLSPILRDDASVALADIILIAEPAKGRFGSYFQ